MQSKRSLKACNEMPRQVYFIAVGACAVDTILTVPRFPEPDTKLRATHLSKRRGGNAPNTLEVLQQLIQHESVRLIAQSVSSPGCIRSKIDRMPKLILIATLPARNSPSIEFMKSSFTLPPISIPISATDSNEKTITTLDTIVDFSHCVYRENHSEPVSSYIISDAMTSSRTIVNHNPLPEMTIAECEQILDDIISSVVCAEEYLTGVEQPEFWFHFEGRIPDVVLAGMRYLRLSLRDEANISLKISVELEKPGRQGLQELVEEADLVFFSRQWAEHEGHTSAEDCVRQQVSMIINLDASLVQPKQRTLICTWGASGACGITQGADEVVHSSAYQNSRTRIVDTTGAGDTFIAGILFAFLNRHHLLTPPVAGAPSVSESESVHWPLRQKLDFANELAGRKILQIGFAELAHVMTGTMLRLDQECQPSR